MTSDPKVEVVERGRELAFGVPGSIDGHVLLRLDPDEMDRVTSVCLRETVLTDWKGLENEDGSPLPYSKEVAGEFLTKPEFRRFREAVIYAATTVGEDDAGSDKADEGNSQSTSAGA